MPESPNQETVSVAVSGGAMRPDEILASLDDARRRLEKSGGKLLRGAPARLLADLEAAKQAVVRNQEADVNRASLAKTFAAMQSEAAANREEARLLRGQAESLDRAVREREARIAALEESLAKDRSRILALEDREKLAAERESGLERARAELHASLEQSRGQVLGLMDQVRTDLTRVAALEARERAVTEQEKLDQKREEMLHKLELDTQAILRRNMELNVKFEEFNASLVKRLDEASAREEAAEERERSLAAREKAVEAWKLDLADREAELSARFDELVELNRQKEALQSELGLMRERRVQELEQAAEALRAREAAIDLRDKEAAAVARALTERNVRLVERKQQLDAGEAELAAKRAHLEALQRTLAERETQIQALEGRVAMLEGKRKELSKTLAKMRTEI